MKLLGNAVCKYRKIILIIALILLIPAIIGMKSTRINYDILVYLPENTETVQGEKILSEDFDMGGFSVIILENMKNKDILKLENKIKEIDNVEKVISAADLIGTEIPKGMLPDKVQNMLYDENKTIMLVTFKEQISSDETINSVQKIREMTDERCKISGMTATLIDTRDLSNSEVIIYVVIAVLLCLIILQLALDSYFVPILLLLNIGIAVLYNMGTNIFLGEISYITKAISAVLQLGVTMDFAIFLYHSYIQEKTNTSSKEKAMASAITKTFTSVLGSSLTTIAGFLALCSMNLTLGKDIGIVMAKGVLLGVISVVTILPAMILECDKLIERTKHKEILPKFRSLKEFIMKNARKYNIKQVTIWSLTDTTNFLLDKKNKALIYNGKKPLNSIYGGAFRDRKSFDYMTTDEKKLAFKIKERNKKIKERKRMNSKPKILKKIVKKDNNKGYVNIISLYLIGSLILSFLVIILLYVLWR